MRKKCWSRARQWREAGQKSWLRGGLSNKVSVNFTFPHFHIILLHFSADSWVLFYWLVWTLRIIGLFFWIYLFAYMLCLILSWFPWRLLYVVDALLHPWTWYIRIMFVFLVNPTYSLAHGCLIGAKICALMVHIRYDLYTKRYPNHPTWPKSMLRP